MTYLGWEERGVVQYAPGDAVEVMVRLVLEDATGQVWGRLIYWDGPALDATAAELLASPVVEVLDAHYSSGRIVGVEVWQCRTLQQHVVSASAARAARNNIAAHVAGM